MAALRRDFGTAFLYAIVMLPKLTGPWATYPKDTTPKRLVVLLHGLGADGNDLFGLVPALAPALPETAFVAPDAPFPCDMAPFGRQWFSVQSRTAAAIEAGVRAKFLQEARVIVAHGAQVQLFHPAAFGVELAEKEHQEGGELSVFFRRDWRALARLVKNRGGGFFGTKIRATIVHAVIGQAAALRMEKVMALLKGGRERSETVDVYIACRREPLNPAIERCR